MKSIPTDSIERKYFPEITDLKVDILDF